MTDFFLAPSRMVQVRPSSLQLEQGMPSLEASHRTRRAWHELQAAEARFARPSLHLLTPDMAENEER